MFSITVALAHTQIVWTFMYRSEASAKTIWDWIKGADGVFEISDDFGQTATLSHNNIAGALFEDLEQSKLAHIERAMHTERVKIQANRAAMADPQIKMAMMSRQSNGPAMFNPVGNSHG